MTEDKFAKTIDDAELDEVAGGTAQQISKDFKFLSDIGAIRAASALSNSSYYDDSSVSYSSLSIDSKESRMEAVAEGWSVCGINFEGDDTANNTYKKSIFGSDYVKRQDAMILAMRKMKTLVNLDNYV